MSQRTARFAESYEFPLDDFQVRAIEALEVGDSVLVAAPTGSGKTVVGEFAVWLASEQDGKAFYTTPIKALSNQKFRDFTEVFGPDDVGLLTGDNSINPSAKIVVMTTEVLRNMIYEGSQHLESLSYVILDEVHYLQDPYRGAVWEEVIIHLPLDVNIASLSATVSNAEEFAEWMQTIRGPTSVVIEEHRPVELELNYLVDGALHPMFVDVDGEPRPNPKIRPSQPRPRGRKRQRGRARGRRGRSRRPSIRRTDVVDLLDSADMLPAIYFIFSRKGCDAAVAQCLREGVSLTDRAERSEIRKIAEERCDFLHPDDMETLGYDAWLQGLSAGLAAHHAGLIPAFKETTEQLFQEGLLKVVFATETLALGINMPARTVFIESLIKFTGEGHELMTAGQFTQLTGRAGRRGKDQRGFAVVPEQQDLKFGQVTDLASSRAFTLESSFQPSYNMATNLARNYERTEAEHLLNSSFGQFRIDREVVHLERLIERNEAYLASYREKMACDRGDYGEYYEMERDLSALESGDDSLGPIRMALETARAGQVYLLPGGKSRGKAAVVGTDRAKSGEPRVVLVNHEAKTIKMGPRDFQGPPKVVGNLATIKQGREMVDRKWGSGKPRPDPTLRRSIAAALKDLDVDDSAFDEPAEDPQITSLRERLAEHPCHGCPDRHRHAQWAKRARRLHREISNLRKRISRHSETLSAQFEKVLGVLDDLGYLTGFELTEKGMLLARIYGQTDLLVAEVLDKGWLARLNPAEIAGITSAFVYESRGPFEVRGRLPTRRIKDVYHRIDRLARSLQRREQRAGLELTRGIESGFVETIQRWCEGSSLDELLDPDMSAGDFIRSTKQTLDLLRQLREATSDDSLRATLTRAIEATDRGVVSYTGVD